ncbi:MAG: nitrogen fixation protein NifM [Pseudomonadota bacterium]
MSSSYVELQVAQQLFGRTTAELDEAQRERVAEVTARRLELERRVLGSPEALGVHVPEAAVDQAMQGLRQRYEDNETFAGDLERNGLNTELLRDALRRQLVMDTVLERVAGVADEISGVDIELFYRLHGDRFVAPERRRARHLLITINEDYAENRRDVALARIKEAAAALHTQSFALVAQRYSECPTAMDGGMLGELRRNMLYPELDEALFALKVGETSGVVESPLGFHLIRCEAVFSELRESLEQATPRIREYLQTKRANQRQKAWLEQLMADAGQGASHVA